MASNKKRTGQSSETFSLRTTAGAGRRTNPKAPKPTAKPAAKAPATPESKKDPEFRTSGGWTGDPNAGKPKAKPSPKPSPSPSSAPKPAVRSTPPKPTEKAPASAPKADAGMKNQDKNYKGSYVSKFKEETARMGATSMSRQQGRSNLTSEDLKPKPAKNYSTPEDKSKYVSPSGALYMGPGYSAGKAEPAKPASPASPSEPNKTSKGMTLAERMRRRRMGLD